MQKKRTIWIVMLGIIFVMGLSFVTPEQGWASQNTAKIVIDGHAKVFNPQPLIQEGTTLVPARGMSEYFGAKVTWDGGKQQVRIVKGKTDIVLTVGQAWAAINGTKKDLGVPAQNIKGTVYVPLRFASEAFGAQVKWNGALKQVEILTSKTSSKLPEPADKVTHNDLTYTVQKGDTIYNIAKAMGMTQEAIISANSLSNPNQLHVGQVLVLPQGDRNKLAVLASRDNIRRDVEGNDDVIEVAKKYIGTPYRYGGTTPKGFDCSGFSGYVYKQLGVKLPRTSRDQSTYGDLVSRDNLRRGDLVFFTTNGTGSVSHVGIYIGDNEFIHSSTKHGVIITSLSTDYYNRRFVTARRVK